MIPSPWVGLVLALAAFRLTRLIGWDDLPPILRARAWATGEKIVSRGSSNAHMELAEPVAVTITYRRPLLAHMIACPYCIGFWVSALVYVGWRLIPTIALYALAPFALSAAVGILARRLDP